MEIVKQQDELLLPADDTLLDTVLEFVQERLDRTDCPPELQMRIAISVEEIYVNIAHYAYAPGRGDAHIQCSVNDEGDQWEFRIAFEDEGKPYNPLAREDPDITLSAEDRPIGGLGLFMVKEWMDEVSYHYDDGKNHLFFSKRYPKAAAV